MPPGITASKLTSMQVEYANSVWPHGNASTLSYLQRLAELNSNVCLTTDTGKLISWCFR